MDENKKVVKVKARPKVKVKVSKKTADLNTVVEPEKKPTVVGSIYEEVAYEPSCVNSSIPPIAEPFPIGNEASQTGLSPTVATEPIFSTSTTDAEVVKEASNPMVTVGENNHNATGISLQNIISRIKSLNRSAKLIILAALVLVVLLAIIPGGSSIDRGAKRAVADYFENHVEDASPLVLYEDIAYVESDGEKYYFFNVGNLDSGHADIVMYEGGEFIGYRGDDRDFDPDDPDAFEENATAFSGDMVYFSALEDGTESDLVDKVAVVDGQKIADSLNLTFVPGEPLIFGDHAISREIQSMKDSLAITSTYDFSNYY